MPSGEPLRTAGLVVTPGESADAATMMLRTAAGCPADADAYNAVMRGHGLPEEGLVITATTSAGMSYSHGFEVYPALTLRDFAADAGTTLTGDYEVAVYCVDSFAQQAKSEFTATIRISAPGRYAAVGEAKGPAALPPREELDLPPASPPPAGSPAPGEMTTAAPVTVAAGTHPESTSDEWLQPAAFVAVLAVALIAAALVAAFVRRRRSQ